MSSDTGNGLRASDADRDGVADALRAHCAAGRLRVDELEERLAAALGAATLDELQRLLQDLPDRPDGQATRPHERARVKIGLPGLRSFRQDHELRSDRTESFRTAVEHILPAMVADGFNVIGRVPGELLVFERRDERVVAAFNRSDAGGTRLVVQGRACLAVRRAFANLGVE